MRESGDHLDVYRRSHPLYGRTPAGSVGGYYEVGQLHIVASNGAGWEHVSVSRRDRCPTWDEMCKVKALFWCPDEVVIQYHPAEKVYVNRHRFCLHLWRPVGIDIPTPPTVLVG